MPEIPAPNDHTRPKSHYRSVHFRGAGHQAEISTTGRYTSAGRVSRADTKLRMGYQKG